MCKIILTVKTEIIKTVSEGDKEICMSSGFRNETI